MNKITPSVPEHLKPGREVELLHALNVAAAAIQCASRSEDAVYRAVCEQIGRIGLRGGVSLLDENGQRLVVRAIAQPGGVLAGLEKLTGLKAEGFEFAVAQVDAYRRVVETAEALFVPETATVLAQLLPARARRFLEPIIEALGPHPGIFAPLMAEGGKSRGYSMSLAPGWPPTTSRR